MKSMITSLAIGPASLIKSFAYLVLITCCLLWIASNAHAGSEILDLTTTPSVNRELALIKISAKHNQRGEIFQVADVFGARIMDVGSESMIIEISGSPEKIEDFLTVMMLYNLTETARSGLVAMERGKKIKKDV